MKVKVCLLLPLSVLLVHFCLPTDSVNVSMSEEVLRKSPSECSKLDCTPCANCCANPNNPPQTVKECTQDCVTMSTGKCNDKVCPGVPGCGQCNSCCAQSCTKKEVVDLQCKTSCESTCMAEFGAPLCYSAMFSVCTTKDVCDSEENYVNSCLGCCDSVCQGTPTSECGRPCYQACMDHYPVAPSTDACPIGFCTLMQDCNKCRGCCQTACTGSLGLSCNDNCIYGCLFSQWFHSCTEAVCTNFEQCGTCGSCCSLVGADDMCVTDCKTASGPPEEGCP